MPLTIQNAVSKFGETAKKKLSSAAASGQPEDQLRAPFEVLIEDIAVVLGFQSGSVTLIGESNVSDLKTRPDYAITIDGALVGYIELKAPGKGADPRRFRDKHDKEQWLRLKSLPNLLYFDGNEFSLWQDGELKASIVHFEGNVETAGKTLLAPDSLATIIEMFLRWNPVAPRTIQELAKTTARLCRLLREEVTEQLALRNPALTNLAEDWRKLLFPEATDERFADGYAQAVVFGILIARTKKLDLSRGIDVVGAALAKTNSLIGSALHILTLNVSGQDALKTSLLTLIRVLNVVDWGVITKGSEEAWLYFYEDFLSIYDNAIRKQTGSYYTPPEVVDAMVRLVHEELQGPRFTLSNGLASPTVTVADPAMGTGTFVLGILRKIAEVVAADQGSGAVAKAVDEALSRIYAFEIQLGPFAVAELRILAEFVHLTGKIPNKAPQLYVTNTLGDPFEDDGYLPSILGKIAETRKAANKIKREQPITVVIGNPPYKEKAKGLGGWVETRNKNDSVPAPLDAWFPPPEWGVGAHSKHLRNLYVYFWRWASWKVFDHGSAKGPGVVCFITVAGFLGGDGFQKMREYLRKTCDAIWVVDCSPEGHQPPVQSRIFEGVQQPICIVLASRGAKQDKPNEPATVKYISLTPSLRREKFKELEQLKLFGKGWKDCSADYRSPFLPESIGAWTTFVALDDIFIYNGSGVMTGRTWVIAPDAETLRDRWAALLNAPAANKERLFHPHLKNGKPGDKHVAKVSKIPLSGIAPTPVSVAQDSAPCIPPERYSYRSFDQQWIIPDSRLINRPNPALWEIRSPIQIFLTALSGSSPSGGPAVTFCAHVPDMDHYKGSFGGRAYSLTLDAAGKRSNIRSALLTYLSGMYSKSVNGEEVYAYIAGVLANRTFVGYFKDDLRSPGLRVPFTDDPTLFDEAVEIGKRIIWLHTYGERMIDIHRGRPLGPPRLPPNKSPFIPQSGQIQKDDALFPDTIHYNHDTHCLHIGDGHVENVTDAMWNYEVSGKKVISQWFGYRRYNRDRPQMGDKRPPSPLSSIQPDQWPSSYTTDLLNLLNVLGLLAEMDEQQEDLLGRILSGGLLTKSDIEQAGGLMISDDENISIQPSVMESQMSLLP